MCVGRSAEAFAAFDRDQSGDISMDEFGMVLHRLGIGLSDAQVADVLAHIDQASTPRLWLGCHSKRVGVSPLAYSALNAICNPRALGVRLACGLQDKDGTIDLAEFQRQFGNEMEDRAATEYLPTPALLSTCSPCVARRFSELTGIGRTIGLVPWPAAKVGEWSAGTSPMHCVPWCAAAATI
jgi:hypothetical protein